LLAAIGAANRAGGEAFNVEEGLMFRKNSFVMTMLRKHWRPAVFAAAAAPLLVAGSNAGFAQALRTNTELAVQLMFTVPVPPAPKNKTKAMYAFDISFVDQTKSIQKYYLGDRSNAAVDVVNAKNPGSVTHIFASPPFAGVAASCPDGNVNDCSGPNGVAAGGGCIFAGDAGGRVVSFDQTTHKQVSSVKNGGKFRADEMAFDPADGVLIVANNADNPPFDTLITVSKTCKLTVGKKVTLDTAFGKATNGAEQTQWDPITGRFYQSIPELNGPAGKPGTGQIGGVARINPHTAKVESVTLIPFCQPAGLSIGQNDIALLGCSVVFDTAGGVWDATDTNTATPYQMFVDLRNSVLEGVVPGIGGSDEVWYNSGDGHFYTGSSKSPYAPTPSSAAQGAGILGVIDGTSEGLDQQVPTFNVPAASGVHPSGSAHSVAANSNNNLVFVPLPANNAVQGCLTGCIGVYGRPDNDTD
jgi:hypothetical protein